MDLYFGLNLDEWKTISIVAQGVLMVILVATGIYQLLAIRAQTKRTATLEMCTRFATDATLRDYNNQLVAARKNGDLEKNPSKYKSDIVGILNFLDMVAIGVRRGIYDEKLTHDYMKWIIRMDVQRYLTGDFPIKANLFMPAYSDLLALDCKWGDPAGSLPEEEKKRRHELIVYGKPSS